MTRLFRVIVHNWPLKLAAVGLATLLYGGLVVSQGTTTFDEAAIPVEATGMAPDGTTFLLNSIDPVTEVRYFSPSGRRPVASTFEATVDLSNVEAGAGPVSVPVQVISIDDEINVVSFTPERVTVELDTVAEKEVPVEVRFEPPPPGLTTGTAMADPQVVTVSGPSSEVDTVVAVRADVVIQASGISVDQEIEPIPVDVEGNNVTPVNVEPRTVQVTIPVFQDVRNKSLPVSPVVPGTPAPGFEIASIVVEPSIVTVAGDAEQLAGLTSVQTAPVSVNGASATVVDDAELAVPSGVVPVDVTTVRVTVTLRPVTGTRSFEAGLDLVGERPGTTYALSTDRVLLTFGGSTADLDRLEGTTIVGLLDVSALTTGTAEITVTVDAPPGVTLVASSPATVSVTAAPAAPASPSPAGAASPVGG